MCPTPYSTMIRSRNHKFDWRLHLALYVQFHDQRARACRFGGERLKREFDLPCGISAVKRILRQHSLTRKPLSQTSAQTRPARHRIRLSPFTRFPMDTKVLQDISCYWPHMTRRALPKVQYSLRQLSCGAQFLAYADEIPLTYAERVADRLLRHLQNFGIALNQVIIQIGNGGDLTASAANPTVASPHHRANSRRSTSLHPAGELQPQRRHGKRSRHHRNRVLCSTNLH